MTVYGARLTEVTTLLADPPAGLLHAGKVRFSATGEPIAQKYCHCNGCRQYHCSIFTPTVTFKSSDFTVQAEEGSLFEVNNTAELSRFSCSTCRTPVYNSPRKFPDYKVTFPMLISSFDWQPSLHSWWSQRMTANEWDDLPKYPEWPPQYAASSS